MGRIAEINSKLYDLDFEEKNAINDFRFDDAIQYVKDKIVLRSEKIQIIEDQIKSMANGNS